MASKRHERRRSCENKHRYDSKNSADKSLRYLTAKKGTYKNSHVYRCAFCGGYHIGSRKMSHTKKKWESSAYYYGY